MARHDSISVNGSAMRVCIDAPGGEGPFPLVVLMCHIGGLDAFTEDRVERLAAAGFVAAAPDVFHYHDWIEDREQRRASLRDARILDDIRACLAHARGRERVDASRTAIMGHCMGGRTAMLGAGHVEDFGPLVIYYGGRTMRSWGEGLPAPFETIERIRGPVLGFFGLDDTEPSPADVDRIEAQFHRHGIECEFHRYEGAGHAFQNFLSPERFRGGPAEDSWQRTLAFLERFLRAA